MARLTKYERCKVYGHHWDELGFAPVGLYVHGDEAFWRCTNCNTILVKVFNSHGYVTYRRYIYEKAYQQVGDRMEIRSKYASILENARQRDNVRSIQRGHRDDGTSTG